MQEHRGRIVQANLRAEIYQRVCGVDRDVDRVAEEGAWRWRPKQTGKRRIVTFANGPQIEMDARGSAGVVDVERARVLWPPQQRLAWPELLARARCRNHLRVDQRIAGPCRKAADRPLEAKVELHAVRIRAGDIVIQNKPDKNTQQQKVGVVLEVKRIFKKGVIYFKVC